MAKALKIRKMESTFTERGFIFTLIAREGDWAVYHQTGKNWSRKSSVYEVVKIRTCPPFPDWPNPEKWDRVEIYPSPKAWGVYGFTVHGREKAIALMRSKATVIVSGDGWEQFRSKKRG